MMSLTQLVLLCGFIAVTLGCSCLPSTKQEDFEKADFVWKVKITSNLTSVAPTIPSLPSMTSTYDYELLTVFKGCFSENPSVLLTGSSGSLCGVTGLQKDMVYVISGTEYNGKLRLNNCSSLVFHITNCEDISTNAWITLRKSMNSAKINCSN